LFFPPEADPVPGGDYDPDLLLLDDQGSPVPWQINLRELWVAVHAITEFGRDPRPLVLGIDSAVTRSWLRRFTARGECRQVAIHLLSRIPKGSRFRTVFLYSGDNLADVPTRPEEEFTPANRRSRHEASWQILTGSHVYENCVAEVPFAQRHNKISVHDLTIMELDKVKRQTERWTHQGLVVCQLVDEEEPSSPSEGNKTDPVERSKRSRSPALP
jgi:hypothetical protein